MAKGKIAIIGGTGFLGTAIAEALVQQGSGAVRIARGNRPVHAVPGADFIAADRVDHVKLREIFRDEAIGDVIDIMTLTLENTQAVLTQTEAAGARYIMISAIDVYANYAGLMRLEQPPVRSQPSRETDALRALPYPYRYLAARPAGIAGALLREYDKIPIEQAAAARPGLRSLILRLPALYGPGDPQQRFDWILKAIHAGKPIAIDDRIADWPQSYLYIEDAARAIARAALSPGEGCYNIAPSWSHSPLDWAQRFLQISGSTLPVGKAPAGHAALLSARADACDLRFRLTLDGQKFDRRFGLDHLAEEDAIAATWQASLRG